MDTTSVAGNFNAATSPSGTAAPTQAVDKFYRLYGDYAHTGATSSLDTTILGDVNANNAYAGSIGPSGTLGTTAPTMSFLDACDYYGNGTVNSSNVNLDAIALIQGTGLNKSSASL